MLISTCDVLVPTFETQRVAVTLADDCPAMREGLARLLADECSFSVAGSAATAAELRESVRRQAPQVLVMDLLLRDGDGLALIHDLLAAAPGLKIVVFTHQPEEVYAARCLQAGVRAYVSKREQVMTLFRAVHQVAAGGVVVPASVTSALFASGHPRETAGSLTAQLTDRELQVFRLVGLALPTREVAKRLGVSVKTVESHRENIKNKLALGSHAELVARAAQWLRESEGA
jgi:DNA-binding NarL/FixJ family response regulator